MPRRLLHQFPSFTAVGLILALPLLAVAPRGSALGLGGALQQSSLGQPLRLVIPIIAAPGDELSGECFKLLPAARDADGVPQIAQGRVLLERTPGAAQLVIVTSRPVNDPVVRVAIQAGCDAGIRRDFTLLLDPPVVEPPLAAAETPGNAGPETAPAAAPEPAPAGTAAPGVATGNPRSASRKAAARLSNGAAAAARPSARRAPPGARAKPKAPAQRGVRAAPPPTRSALEQPRLTISAAPPAPTLPIVAGNDAERAVRAQETALALEAETAVLRQRVAELSGLVDRMQQEMQAASVARLAAEEAARRSPLAVATRWWESNWPILAAVVGLLSLVAGGLVWKRRRVSSLIGEWPITGTPGSRFAPASSHESPAAPLTQRGGETPLARPLPEPASKPRMRRIDAAQAVAVTELSQVTEEARVYLALDRPDRAIDVLRDHIAQQPRSMPAAWLMLLDLYRTQGREKEFRQLADAFHQHFNVQTPLWENHPGHEAGDAGIEAFPHVVQQLVTSWGTEDCRSTLERLLFDNRQGRRAGFSLVAYDDILSLRQLLEVLLTTPEGDLEEEAKLRTAWTLAKQSIAPTAPSARAVSQAAAPSLARAAPPALPMMLDLELDLALDGVAGDDLARCCLETDHPAVLRELTRDWGQPAVIDQLRDLLVTEKRGAPRLSPEAVSELMLLQRVALAIASPAL